MPQRGAAGGSTARIVRAHRPGAGHQRTGGEGGCPPPQAPLSGAVARRDRADRGFARGDRRRAARPVRRGAGRTVVTSNVAVTSARVSVSKSESLWDTRVRSMKHACRCPHCDARLSADAPEGLCPECLFREAVSGGGTAAFREDAGAAPGRPFMPPSPAELAGHFPQLEIVRLLGQGGMGAVYLARQPELDRLVALKILPPGLSDAAFMERFSREARLLARLSHPNIVTIFEFGTKSGLHYFTMEYVDGQNLRQLLQAGEIAPQQALKII